MAAKCASETTGGCCCAKSYNNTGFWGISVYNSYDIFSEFTTLIANIPILVQYFTLVNPLYHWHKCLNNNQTKKTAWQDPPQHSEGVGIIQGWQGKIVSYVYFFKDNRIVRFYPRDPSVLDWTALEKIVLNNIVPDFQVCNKSINGSYFGHDL